MQKGSIWPQVFAATSASLILVNAGFHYRWLPVFIDKTISSEEYHLANVLPLMVSPLSIGSVCGAIFGSIVVDFSGRRTTLLFTTVPMIISSALIAFASSYYMLYLARFIGGLVIGVAYTVTPMYIGEIAEARIRGGLCVLMSVMMHMGMIKTYMIGPLVAMPALAIIEGTIPVVFATLLLWAPESPYYYAMKRNVAESQKSIAWLRGTPDVVQEVQLIQNSMALNRRRGVNFINLFGVFGNRKALFVMIGLVTCHHLSGAQVLYVLIDQLLYPDNFAMVQYLVISIPSLIGLFTSICIVFLTDKVGRQPLLLLSASLCAAFMAVITLCYQLIIAGIEMGDFLWIPGAATVGYSFSYAIGLGTLPNVISSEIFNCEVKAPALGISTAYYFAMQFGMAELLNTVSITYGYLVMFYVFTICNLLSAIFVYVVVPETKGRSLNQIQNSIHGRFDAPI